MKKPKVALGMSGGVDSSLCAHLLVEQGYEVTGVYLECWRAPGCRTEQDRKDALKIALKLDIPFQVLDFKQTYKDKVVELFFDQYEAGMTPNPDIACNSEIKFGLFYDWAREHDFNFVATGHYAAIKEIDGLNQLVVPADTHKDQTYFLHQLKADQLDHIIFPLANYQKKEVRAEAEKRHIHTSDKKDSVGICFIGDIKVKEFLRERLGENPGDVVDIDGTVIGKHQGLWFYTIGQRHGFSIDKVTTLIQKDGTTISKHNFPPFYVIEKKPATNQLVVGFGAQTLKKSFSIRPPHLIQNVNLEDTPNLKVRIRHTGELLEATFNPESNLVTLTKPAKGVAAGQYAVFYADQAQHTVCLGGGQISLVEKKL